MINLINTITFDSNNIDYKLIHIGEQILVQSKENKVKSIIY